MKTPSFHDIEQLSAFLDGNLSPEARARLSARLESDSDLRAKLEELRQTRALLRRTPKRRAPRNFTLSLKTAGVKPPLPRSVPALGWASAVAFVLFALTFLTNLAAPVAFAPMAAAVPKVAAPVLGSASSNSASEAAAPLAQDLTLTPTLGFVLRAAPLATPQEQVATPALPPTTSLQASPPLPTALVVAEAHALAFHLSSLQVALGILALGLGLFALLILLSSRRTFSRNLHAEDRRD
jgi:anti-sigma factor RsiW